MPNLSATDLRPFIPAQNFDQSKLFYSSLGWTVKDLAPRLALVELQDGRFYVQDYYVKEFAENAMLHISVEDAQAWYEHITKILKDNRFPSASVQPPKVQPYGAIVTFVIDPAGVLLHLCQWTT